MLALTGAVCIFGVSQSLQVRRQCNEKSKLLRSRRGFPIWLRNSHCQNKFDARFCGSACWLRGSIRLKQQTPYTCNVHITIHSCFLQLEDRPSTCFKCKEPHSSLSLFWLSLFALDVGKEIGQEPDFVRGGCAKLWVQQCRRLTVTRCHTATE